MVTDFRLGGNYAVCVSHLIEGGHNAGLIYTVIAYSSILFIHLFKFIYIYILSDKYTTRVLRF